MRWPCSLASGNSGTHPSPDKPDGKRSVVEKCEVRNPGCGMKKALRHRGFKYGCSAVEAPNDISAFVTSERGHRKELGLCFRKVFLNRLPPSPPSRSITPCPCSRCTSTCRLQQGVEPGGRSNRMNHSRHGRGNEQSAFKAKPEHVRSYFSAPSVADAKGKSAMAIFTHAWPFLDTWVHCDETQTGMDSKKIQSRFTICIA